ncbi:hypothetical protein [Viridibacillus arvi]|uniref:hypothetical protein n=1 Tax=Viridibacillus arvi TaxID=263475 RepID=UPI0034CDE43C
MGKYSLKFIKPLVTLTLGAAIITGAVVGVSEEALAEAKYKISNGLLVSKTNGKVVDGTVTYKGKVYKKGKLLTGTKGNVYYKSGKRATGSYKGKYYLKGKLFTGIANGTYYKSGKKATGVYKGIYYNKGKAYTGLANDIYYKNGKKATGTFEGKYYLKGIVFTGLHPKTGDLYIDGVLNLGYRIYNGDLYNGSRLNVGIIQYNGLWYDGKTVANGTIKTPGGQIITVINGIQTSGGSTNQGGSGSSGGYYQSEFSKAIAVAKGKLAALQFFKDNDIDNATKLTTAKLQYNEAKIAVDAAVAKGAVATDFGTNYSKLASQKTEIDRYESAFKAKLDAIAAAESKLAALKYTGTKSIGTKDNLTEAKTQIVEVQQLIDEATKKGAVTKEIKGMNRLDLQQNEIQRYMTVATAIDEAKIELAALKFFKFNSIENQTNLEDAQSQYKKAKEAVEAAKAEGALVVHLGINYFRLDAQGLEIKRYETVKAVAIQSAKTALKQLGFSGKNSIKNDIHLKTAKAQYYIAQKAVEAAEAKGAVESDFGTNYSNLGAQQQEINRFEAEVAKNAAITEAKKKLRDLSFIEKYSINSELNLNQAKKQYDAAKTAVDAAIAKGAEEKDFGPNYSKMELQQQEIKRYEAEAAKDAAITEAKDKLHDLSFIEKYSINSELNLNQAKKQYDAAKTAVDAAIAKGAEEKDFAPNYSKMGLQQQEIKRYEAEVAKDAAITNAKDKLADLKFIIIGSINNNDQLNQAKEQYKVAQKAVDDAILKGANKLFDFGLGYLSLALQKGEIERYEAVKSAAINNAVTKLASLNFFEAKSIDGLKKLNQAILEYSTAKLVVDDAIRKGAVEADFGPEYSRLAEQNIEINRYLKDGRSMEINNLNEDGDLEGDVEKDIKDSDEENKEITEEDKGTTEEDKEVTEDKDKETTEEDKEVTEDQDKGTTEEDKEEAENQDKETTEDQNNELTGVQS